MVAVCTIATLTALKDVKVFLKTLELFNTSPPTVYLLCDTGLQAQLPKYKGQLNIKTTLDEYQGDRQYMTMSKGQIYQTRWEDFMMEKATVLEWAFNKGETQLYFCDSDICFMGPLPEVPNNVQLGVCPHRIRPHDEQRFGKYNAGLVYTTDPAFPKAWRQAAHTSRYFDQAALEDIVNKTEKDKVYEFPTQVNYGWWRMFQGTKSVEELQKEWSIFRSENTSGLRVAGSSLLSIHTHFGERRDQVTAAFNQWVFTYLARLGAHSQALTKFLSQEFPHLKIPKN
uniref:Nucleotide-diphospho-sugar transferase domain-containing protein n=1 Tax=viral metagenome TaxID=1070528 RepID=A0A6C0KXA1_9ZZZZ